jgi:hypothetical protein
MSPLTKTFGVFDAVAAKFFSNLMQCHLYGGGAGFMKACEDYEP